MMKLLSIFAILIFSSCGTVSKKPVIDLCAHNASNGQVPCVNNQTNEVNIYRIEQTDKWIMLKPDHWAKILFLIRKYTTGSKSNYQSIEPIVKRELKKIINIFPQLQSEINGI